MNRATALKTIFGIAAAVLVGWLLVWGLREVGAQPLQTVDLEGELKAVSPQEIQLVIAPLYGKPLMEINTDLLEERLEDIAWIKEARIQRRWPDGLRVILEEHQAMAHWLDGRTITEAGVLVDLGKLDNLPVFAGDEEQLPLIIKNYRWLEARYAQLGQSVAEISLGRFGSWQVVLRSGADVRYGEPLRERQRLLEQLRSLFVSRWEELERIDLRHERGLSVSWKTAAGDTQANGAARS